MTESSSLRQKIFALLQFILKRDLRYIMASYSPDHLRALKNDIRRRSEEYDAIIITGDISTTGCMSDMKTASQLIKGIDNFNDTPFSKGEWIPPKKLALLPGNHDRYSPKSLLPLSNLFEHDDHFTTEWCVHNKSSGNSRNNINIKYIDLSNGRKMAVILIDFSYTSKNHPYNPLKYLGQGLACPNLLKKAKALTLECHSTGIPAIWATHFPAEIRKFPIAIKGRTLMLKNGKSVIKAAKDVGINVILSGHTHTPKIIHHEIEGTSIHIVQAGSATGADKNEGHSYYNLQINIAGINATLHSHTLMVAKKIYNSPDFTSLEFTAN